ARLEDNRSTATIAKPNDLVHAQHLEETTFHKSNKVKETEARVEATANKENATTEKEETIKETTDTLTSLQGEVASLKAKWSLDANEEIKKDHTLVHELEKQVEKLPMELQLKNNVRGALETKDSLHDLQEVKTKRALKIDDEEFKKAKSEKVYDAWLPPWLASCLVVYQPYVKNHWKEFMFIQGRIWDPGIKIYFRHHLEDKVVLKDDSATAKEFTAVKPSISKRRDKCSFKGRDHCCAPLKKPLRLYPKTDDVPLTKDEKKIWKEFREFDKDIPGLGSISLRDYEKERIPVYADNPIARLIGFFAINAFNELIHKPGLGSISLRDYEKERIPIKVENPIVRLIGVFAIAAFNKLIHKHVKPGITDNLYACEFMECSYIKMDGTNYYFHMTIEAMKDEKLGVYETKVNLK
ncbi:hypothetical protein Tco_0620301, partial [Tanacetum coccineum]